MSQPEHFVLFIGSTRSGHSLVGALVDAHRHAVIAHEVDVFAVPRARGGTVGLRFADRGTLFDALLVGASRHHDRGHVGHRIRPDGSSYEVSYAVPNQHQGRYDTLRVLGNKQGQSTATALQRRPDALELLHEQVRVPLRLIHVIRNPFDNIATLSSVHGHRSAVRYFDRCAGADVAKASRWPVLDVYLEQFIASPQRELARICDFLDLDAPPDYLDDCASIVMDQPSESRTTRVWTEGDVRFIRRRMAQHDWLEPYADTEVPVHGRLHPKKLRQAVRYRAIARRRRNLHRV